MNKIFKKSITLLILSLIVSLTYTISFYLMYNYNEVTSLNVIIFILTIFCFIYSILLNSDDDYNNSDKRIIQFNTFSYLITLLTIGLLFINPSATSLFALIFSVLFIWISLLFNILMVLDIKKHI